MKNTIVYLSVAATMLSGGCIRQDESNPIATSVANVAVVVKSDHIGGDARAVINDGYESGHFTGSWEAGDRIAATVTYNGTTERIPMYFDAESKLFRGNMKAGRGNRTYRAVYPYSNTDGRIPFGRERSQRGNSFNSVYDAMLSPLTGATGSEAGVDEKGRALVFDLKHLTSILAIRFTTTDATVKSEEVKAIVLSSDDMPLSAATLDIDTASESAALNAGGRSKHIVALYDPATAPSAAEARAFFNVLPGNYDKLKIDIVTSGHIASVDADRTGKALTAGKLYYMNTDSPTWRPTVAPTAVWFGNEKFEPVKIVDDMTGKCSLDITASAGVRKMSVKIDSPILTPAELESVGLAADMDIVDNEQYASTLSQFGLTTGDELVGRRYVEFNIEKLVPLIKQIAGGKNCENRFTITAEDFAGRTVEKTMTFTVAPDDEEDDKVEIVYNNDADLWANTATLTVENGDAWVSVKYRQVGQTSWLSTTDMGEGKFRIEPVYQESPAKDKVLAGKVALSQTGVRLGGEYEAVAMSGGNIVASTQFKVGGKRDVIPNAGMDDWSKYSVEGLMVGGEVSYPNKADGEKFWVSGNNKQTPNLCSANSVSGVNGARCAMLKGASALGIFAAGNLFTGEMAFGTSFTAMGCGYARFGQKYTFTARPSALRVRLKANIGTMTHIGANDPLKDKEHIKGQTKDVARIYYCITDWRERHTVQGGMQLDKNTLWNPAEQSAVSEGKIIGYGLIDITENTDWKELSIPVIWYDTVAKPMEGNYSLVISVASSTYGDYLTGSTESSLCVEDFEWVY